MAFLGNLAKRGLAGGAIGAYATNPSFRKGVNELVLGKPERKEQLSLLTKEQQPLFQQLQAASMGQGAGGAFGDAADYYRGLLSGDSADMEAFAAPELRRFQEQIVPGLAEQFAGMGSGALSSSGFRNAATRAGTDLSERLAQIRANLRQQGAQGLSGIGQQGLGRFAENVIRPAQPGLLQSAASGFGQALGKMGSSYLGGF